MNLKVLWVNTMFNSNKGVLLQNTEAGSKPLYCRLLDHRALPLRFVCNAKLPDQTCEYDQNFPEFQGKLSLTVAAYTVAVASL